MPTDGEAQLFLGMALVQLKRGKEAMGPLQRDLDQFPKDVRAWAALADALALQGMFSGARQAWMKVIEIQQQALGAEAESDPYVQAARVMLPRLESQPAPPAPPTPPH
jgi:Flp pilus assembly protein TadD